MLLNFFMYLIGLILIYLIIIIFSPVFPKPKQSLESNNEFKAAESLHNRIDISFKVEEDIIRGWLYLPDNISGKVPCVILNNGFGGTKDMILENYAKEFIKEGIAALSFDYRFFGESDGEPRQMFSVNRQIEDLLAAVNYIKNREEIDEDNIAIWGTSAAGGYGIIAAAKDKDIKCIIGQCPGLDNDDNSDVFKREGIGFFIELFMHAQRDKGRSRFNLSSHTIPIVGKPHTTAMHTAPGAYKGYNELATDNFKNEVCARLILMRHLNPIDFAGKIECPALFQICENDQFVSAQTYEKAEKILDEKAKFIKYPIGHFDIYKGENFEQAVNEQIKFLKENFS